MKGASVFPLSFSWPGTLCLWKKRHNLVAFTTIWHFLDLAGSACRKAKMPFSYKDILFGNFARRRDYVVVDHTVITGDWLETYRKTE